MKNFELTLTDCIDIIQKDDHFYQKSIEIDGCKVDIFNYRLASYMDFKKIPNSCELRGLTFIDGKRFLSLPKFFNLNESEEISYDRLKNIPIKSVTKKMDGSLVRFVKINNKVLAKTKMDFFHETIISLAMEKFYSDNNFKHFINYCLDNRLAPLFELVSPLNQIVCFYPKTELILLKVRNEETGEYIPLSNFDYAPKVEEIKFNSLDEIINTCENTTEEEGFVVEFENGTLVKIKTPWYLVRHRLFTEDSSSYLFILQNTLDEKIDDLLGELGTKAPEKSDFIKKNVILLTDYFNKTLIEIKDILNSDDKNLSRKDFAIKYKNYDFFGVLMQNYGLNSEEKIIKSLKEFLKKKYNSESKCQELITSLEHTLNK